MSALCSIHNKNRTLMNLEQMHTGEYRYVRCLQE